MGKHKKSKKSKHSKKERKHKHKRSSSSESSSQDEWVEKSAIKCEVSTTPPRDKEPKLQREDWLSMNEVFLTSSTSDRRKKRELEKMQKKQGEQYDPSKCGKELNPYWKDGGTGLPTFKKPSDSLDSIPQNNIERKSHNWKVSKKSEPVGNGISNVSKTMEQESLKSKDRNLNQEKSIDGSTGESVYMSLNPNQIAAKLVKAEIMGNTKLIEELKLRLDEAKKIKLQEEENNTKVILTQTDLKGYSRPLRSDDDEFRSKKKKRKVETYSGKERTSYFADDDKYSLKEMFEAEKFSTIDSVNKEFAKMAGDVKKNDDLADLFIDKIRHEASSSKDVDSAISQHQKMSKSLDNCSKCFKSETMPKHLMIEYNDSCYLYLPYFEPLTEGHCLISPVRHISCAVQLDENEWSEINSLRLKLFRLFEQKGNSVIFFEIAKSFNRYPHMVLECIPVPKRKGDLAPIYFKKAIEESETEWSMNKKLISLKNRDVRRAVPKGLPYFFVNFGMNDGFAHVIEDQSMFPNNFAQEIIGGMLGIDHSKWRKPKKENFSEQKLRVLEFNKLWKKLDDDSS